MAAAMVMSMSLTWIGGSSWLWARRGRARAVDGRKDARPCPCPIAARLLALCAARCRGQDHPSTRCWSAPPTPGREAVDSPRAHSFLQIDLRSVLHVPPVVPRRTARAWPAGRLGRRRFVVPRRLWLPTSCSRQGRARRHSRKFPSPTNHRPATGHISRACREAATTRSTPQVASAPRARTSPPSWSCTCSAGSGHR